MKKCETCNHIIHVGCNYSQGRCPHREPLIDTNKIVEWFKNVFNKDKK